MVRCALAILVCLSGVAGANQPDHAYDETELHERWSWAPLVSALIAADSMMTDAPFSLLGAQLRVRYGHARRGNALHGQDTPMLLSVGLAFETAHFDTLEPSVVIGVHRLPAMCECWGEHVWLDLRLDLGAGHAWGDTRDAPFVNAKLGLGAMFTRQARYTRPGRHGPISYSKEQFRSQFDLVVEAQFTVTGDWRVGFGVEFDPLRLIPDFLGLARYF